jgi:hypothetical protein
MAKGVTWEITELIRSKPVSRALTLSFVAYVHGKNFSSNYGFFFTHDFDRFMDYSRDGNIKETPDNVENYQKLIAFLNDEFVLPHDYESMFTEGDILCTPVFDYLIHFCLLHAGFRYETIYENFSDKHAEYRYRAYPI